MNMLAALHHAAPDPGCRTLTLRFDDPAFTTTLALDGPDVRGVQGPVTPPWSTTLLHHGVHPVVLLDAQQQARTLDDALGTLLRQGVVTSVDLAHLARERFLHALLPLMHQRAELHVTPGARPPSEAVPRVSVQRGVEDLTRRRALGRPDGAPSLTQAYAASPARVVEAPDGTPEALVYRAALQGWTLQDMARRLPLRWDVLRDRVGQLSVTGEIWPQDVTRPGAVHARLAAGQVAPDFVLPALGGGDVRLSGLRGRRVWLSFNRQSTCAICNPRHAAVIAVQSYLAPQGVQTVSIWGSTVADLALGIGRQRPPYPVLADPDDHTYARYGLTHSLRGTLDPRNLGTILQGFAMMGAAALKSDGELLRMPAEFLIGPDGVIERAHYAAFGADFLPLEDVIAWSQGATGGGVLP